MNRNKGERMKIEVSPQIAGIFVSWKTSLAGVVAFVCVNGPQLQAYFTENAKLDAPKFLLGLAMLVMGLISRDSDKSSEQHGAGQTVPEVPKASTLPLFLLVPGLLFLTGCVTSTPARKQAEDEMVKRYETAYSNETARAEANGAALNQAVLKRLDTELKIAVANVVALGKSDPVKYPPNDVSAEIARLYAVRTDKATQFGQAQANFSAIKTKNEATNLAGARSIYAAIKRADAAPAVNLTATVDAALGTAPPKATLMEP